VCVRVCVCTWVDVLHAPVCVHFERPEIAMYSGFTVNSLKDV